MSGAFCKLADPGRYVGCPWDLTADHVGRAYWVDSFKRHHLMTLELAGAAARAAACRDEFFHVFDAYAADPQPYGRVDIITLDRWRDGILRRHGYSDPYWNLKQSENAKALPLLAGVCRELDSLNGAEQFQAAFLGILAGNVFDMGSEAVARDYLGTGRSFHDTRLSIHPRPWVIDHFDALSERMVTGTPHRKAVYFVDNAGSDFLLGAIPMMRWLARRGTKVVLAANSGPTLNDMTLDEVNAWWPKILAAEPSIAGLAIEAVGTGTSEPLIDLLEVSDELNAAAADADLVILEGMGRGVESNLDAEFSCDSLNVAMIKDRAVAARHGGELFDCVCRWNVRT